MKTVTIKKLTLHYFKGVKNGTYEFGPTTNTISGPNGCGKSTIMDAFNWCLWGKNAAGRADFLIKTVDENGVEIPHVEHSVEIELLVNGEPQTFTRSLVPEYDRNDALKGNHTDYSWCNVPMKKIEYDSKVREIISEELFKLISSTTAFMNLDWQKQRSMLLNIAGKVEDITIAEKLDQGEDGEYHLLLKKMDGKTIEEYKRELDAQLKRVNESMNSLPARIDEVSHNTPEMPDLAAIDEQRKQLEQQLQEIEKQERDDTAALNARNKERNELTKQIEDLKWKRMQIVHEEESKARNKITESNQTYLKAEAELKGILAEQKIDSEQTAIRTKQFENSVKTNTTNREKLQQQIADLRNEWMKINSQTFTASQFLVCPMTGSVCQDGTANAWYDNDQQGAFVKFNKQKNDSLSDITMRGTKMAAQIQELVTIIESSMKEVETLKNDLLVRKVKRDERMAELEMIMTNNPKRPLIAHIDESTIPELAELDQQIAEQMDKLASTKYAQPINTDNGLAKWNIRKQIEQLGAETAKIGQIEAAKKRIEQLENEYADLGQQKSTIEINKRLLLDFEIERMNVVSDKVNSMFMMVKFRMFERQVNGEEVPACVCLCNGVRWQDANTATRINAGIDIASVLANAAKSFAPMFVDGAESVGNLYMPKLPIQQIRLKFDPKSPTIAIERK